MLRRKMIRDIRQNLSQFITILLMVFIGIMAYSGIESYMEGMKETANNFYGDYNLQDLNVMGELSEENINTIKEISNVKNAEGKLKVNGVLENDDDTTISMNFIEENEISKFYIVDGENFNKDTKGIWLDNFFAEENNLKIGDILKIKYDGYVFEEKIVGLINVPDHVYDVKDESQLYPDHKTFGFAYASSNELEGFIKNQVMKEANLTDESIFNQVFSDFNYKDYIKYNYIMVDIDNKEKFNEVKNSIEEKIDNVAVIDIEDTASYKQYQGEIEEGETYIGVFSGLFLFIALLSVVTTMNRVVKKQNEKVTELSFCPPVPWIQNNDWPVCCDDYMKYIGEWEKTDFINQSSHEEYINYFKKLLDKKMLERIDDIETLIEDLGYDSVAYAFRCICCNKVTIVCQNY